MHKPGDRSRRPPARGRQMLGLSSAENIRPKGSSDTHFGNFENFESCECRISFCTNLSDSPCTCSARNLHICSALANHGASNFTAACHVTHHAPILNGADMHPHNRTPKCGRHRDELSAPDTRVSAAVYHCAGKDYLINSRNPGFCNVV